MKILFSLFLLSVWGCNSPVLEKDELIYLNVDTLTYGSKFDVYYNGNHKDNKLDFKEEYDASIAFMHKGLYKYYNVKMYSVKDKILKGSFQVPDSANTIHINIGPSRYVSQQIGIAEFPIFDKNKKPSKETINYLLLRAPGLEAYNELIKLDTLYYYDDYRRDFIISRLEAEQGVGKENISERINMLENLLRKDYNTDYKVRLNLLLNIHSIYVLIGDYDSSIEYLDSISYYLINKNINQSDIDYNIEYLNQFPFFRVYSQFMTKPTKEQYKSIKEKYIEIAMLSNNHLAEIELHKTLSLTRGLKQIDSLNTKFIYHLLNNIYKYSKQGAFYYYSLHNNIFVDIFNYLFDIMDYDNAEKILGIEDECFRKHSKWRYSRDLNDYTTKYLDDRNYNFTSIYNIKLFVARGDLGSAKELALKFYNYFSNYDYWKARVASDLIDIYLLENNLDSAEHYLSEMFIYNDEHRLTNLEKINTFRKDNSLPSLTETALREKYSIEDLHFQSFRHFNLNIDGTAINTSTFGDTLTVLLNINDDCPACNNEAPLIKEYLKPYISNGKCKLIFVSDNPKAKLYQTFGKDIIISKRTADMKKTFGLADKPSDSEWKYAFIIKNNKYLESKNYFKEMNWIKKYF